MREKRLARSWREIRDETLGHRPRFSYGGVPEQRDVPEHPHYHVLDETHAVTWADLERFSSGAVRDSQEGKLRYDLISPLLLRRLAEHLEKGARRYGEHNWTKGIPSGSYMASLLRHVEAYRSGDRDEDHLAAAVFNLMGLMHNEYGDLDDLYDWGHG
ncbi:dATP/dGTP diphosphohydrolase domain-containing protein [Plantactinospora solaniradicis]|uniref:dATP/dGTP diphosphohydrolase domain-containing protein n=1 Tax=Plantactinospora solaniradicis TaxID=1723736 RepID=A0ABW1KIC9_9ACTN